MNRSVYTGLQCGLRKTDVFFTERSTNYNQLIMDIFNTQIIAAIKKVKTQKGRPDGDKIFKEIVKESATNFTLGDIQ